MSDMKLTTEQRIAALERENTVLQDKLKLMHKMLKEQRQLINDYIMQRMAAPATDEQHTVNTKSDEDAMYTFVCQQRFDRIIHLARF